MNIQSKFAYVGFFAYLCSRKAAMGYGRWAMGDGLWAMGYGLWAMGDGLWAMGHGR